MIPLKTGPYLALDASSSGDSYFVKIKLKSISNVPAVCCSQGAGEALAQASVLPRALCRGRWPRGQTAPPQLGVKFTTCHGPRRVWFWRREEAEGLGYLLAALKRSPERPMVAPHKETQLLFCPREVFLQAGCVPKAGPPFSSPPEVS